MIRRIRWRAWTTFQVSLAGAFLAFLAFLATSFILHQRDGELTESQSATLLRLLYWGTYPLVFVALGALAWHLVRFYRGDYARR